MDTLGEEKERGRVRPSLSSRPSWPASATHLDMRHQLRLLQEQEGALGALEHAHLSRAGVLVKVLLDVPLLVEDHLTGALIDEPVVTRRLRGQENQELSGPDDTPAWALSPQPWPLLCPGRPTPGPAHSLRRLVGLVGMLG